MTADEISDIQPQLANCRDCWLQWGISGRSDSGLVYYRSGLLNAQLNGVLCLADCEPPDQAVDHALDQFVGVPWSWWVGRDSGPGVGDGLVRRGAVKVGTLPIMAVHLDKVASVQRPDALEIEATDDCDGVREWVRAYAPSIGVPPEALADVIRAAEESRTDGSHVVRVTGRVEGEPVATALMLDRQGVAGVYVVSTAPAHRRQGIGAAVTQAALGAGRERGLRIGTLQASSMGAPVYRRMGFEKVAEYEVFQFTES
ncbi:GNAT family N-acetyltransferase [Streptomyces sp. NPDC006207]